MLIVTSSSSLVSAPPALVEQTAKIVWSLSRCNRLKRYRTLLYDIEITCYFVPYDSITQNYHHLSYLLLFIWRFEFTDLLSRIQDARLLVVSNAKATVTCMRSVAESQKASVNHTSLFLVECNHLLSVAQQTKPSDRRRGRYIYILYASGGWELSQLYFLSRYISAQHQG